MGIKPPIRRIVISTHYLYLRSHGRMCADHTVAALEKRVCAWHNALKSAVSWVNKFKFEFQRDNDGLVAASSVYVLCDA